MNDTTTTSAFDRSPRRGRRLATKLLVTAGTVGVVLLTSDSVMAARVAEHTMKRQPSP